MREQAASADMQLAAAAHHETVGVARMSEGAPASGHRLSSTRKPPASVEAARLTELARAAGLGDSPDAALAWHREALDLLGTDEPSPLLADVLRWQGSVLRDRGQTSAAQPLYEQSLAIAIELEYDSGHAHALNCLALAQRRGDIAGAASYFGDALSIAERAGERRLLGCCGRIWRHRRHSRRSGSRARALPRGARDLQASHDHQHASWVLSNLGLFRRGRGTTTTRAP